MKTNSAHNILWDNLNHLALITHTRQSIYQFCKGNYPQPSRVQDYPPYPKTPFDRYTLIFSSLLASRFKRILDLKSLRSARNRPTFETVLQAIPRVPAHLSVNESIYVLTNYRVRPLVMKDLKGLRQEVRNYLQGDSNNPYVAVYLTIFGDTKRDVKGYPVFLNSSYRISKETGISQHTLGMLRHHKAKISNLTFGNAMKLRSYCFKHDLDIPRAYRKTYQKAYQEGDIL